MSVEECIFFHPQEVPQSPFTVKVDPSHDASKVKAEGPGLARTGTFKALSTLLRFWPVHTWLLSSWAALVISLPSPPPPLPPSRYWEREADSFHRVDQRSWKSAARCFLLRTGQRLWHHRQLRLLPDRQIHSFSASEHSFTRTLTAVHSFSCSPRNWKISKLLGLGLFMLWFFF